MTFRLSKSCLFYVPVLWMVVGLTACGPTKFNQLSDLKDDAQRIPKALFHPVDPSLDFISQEILNAKENIDIAMYSMDVSQGSPVMRAFASQAFQEKLTNGLTVRLIFEGYGDQSDVEARSKALEELGIDVRWKSGGRKIHHKFAVIDSKLSRATVISGSANWSLGSMKNYDESILIWPNDSALAIDYQREFNLLWTLSQAFQIDSLPGLYYEDLDFSSRSARVFFNSDNFIVSGGQLRRDPSVEGWTLTKQIVSAIEKAEKSIKIASTRLVLRPIYDALVKAANRGVKVELVVNQDQYGSKQSRLNWELKDCEETNFDPSCSSGVNFSWFLDQGQLGSMMDLRLKFFTLNLRMPLSKQMHSKYLIVDDAKVLAGSFNWSVSSEWDHIENVQVFDSTEFPSIVARFVENHAAVFQRGRDDYTPYLDRLKKAAEENTRTNCSFDPMSLSFDQIDSVIELPKQYGLSFSDICQP